MQKKHYTTLEKLKTAVHYKYDWLSHVWTIVKSPIYKHQTEWGNLNENAGLSHGSAKKSLQECWKRPDMLIVRITDSHSHLWMIERREQRERLHSLEQTWLTRRQISAICLGLACVGILIKNILRLGLV